MDSQPVDRRRFNHLVGAAFGGLVAGTTLGCSDDQGKGSTSGGSASAATAGGNTALAAAGEKHACRGLNECKGQGADGKNTCAGQGICANVKPHTCGGQNDCKNLGGCGKEAGANACKGMGGCEVPMTHAWETARKNFEKRMTEAKKSFGAAPPAPAKKG